MGTHYLAKSRQVLELNDVDKLHSLLAEQRAELARMNMCFGAKRGTQFSSKKPLTNKMAIRNTRKNIARILTRLSQLKQKERLAK